MLSSKDMNFMGYTYKNFEIVNDHEVPGMGKYYFVLALSELTMHSSLSNSFDSRTYYRYEHSNYCSAFVSENGFVLLPVELKKKNNKPKRPTVKSLFSMIPFPLCKFIDIISNYETEG